MKLRGALLVPLLAAALAVPVAASARRLAEGRDALETAQARLHRMSASAQRILDLRARQERVADRKRPEQDVIARVNAVLAGAAIPLDRFGGLRPEADTALPGLGPEAPPYRRQSVRVSLNGLTVGQLGAFLGGWTASQHLWTPTRLELTHVRDGADPARYDVSILITATYVGER